MGLGLPGKQQRQRASNQVKTDGELTQGKDCKSVVQGGLSEQEGYSEYSASACRAFSTRQLKEGLLYKLGYESVNTLMCV